MSEGDAPAPDRAKLEQGLARTRARHRSLRARTARLRESAGRLARPLRRAKARADRIPEPHDGQAQAERSWKRFFSRAVPLSALLALAALLIPGTALWPLVLGLGLGALLTGLLVLRRLEDIAQEADQLEQENARLLAEVEARDPALAERETLRDGVRVLLKRDAEHRRAQVVLGHELRNPLAGIVGVTRLLAETDLTEEQHSYTQAVLRAAGAMRTLTDDLVAGAAEGGKTAPVRLGALVGDVAELLAPGAHAKGLDLAAFVAPGLPREVMLDERRLRQVLLNCVGNAIKYTDEGGVGIVADRGADGRLTLSVIDSGVGIAPEDRARMFEAFARAEETEGREGVGLGLALVARLVAEMDGTVALGDGPDGRGTQVTVSLPLHAAPGAEALAAQDLAGRSVRLDASRPITSALLARGLTARQARLAEAGADVVIHDLTDRDAARFATEQDLGDEARRVVILRPDQRRALPALRQAGVDGYLIAPVRPRSLVAQVLGETGRAAVDEARRVLLVEDDAVNGLVASRLLETEGWSVSWAKDGAAALRVFEEAALAGTPFRTVLTDLDLPEIDGPQLIARLSKSVAPPRIVVVSAEAPADAAARLPEGASVSDILAKPLSRAALADVLAD
ncbi:MAG: ATP-binding protein [Pseudomonadota bacterium]